MLYDVYDVLGYENYMLVVGFWLRRRPNGPYAGGRGIEGQALSSPWHRFYEPEAIKGEGPGNSHFILLTKTFEIGCLLDVYYPGGKICERYPSEA